jgi:glycosyltransferase involved in cell wall biosynthesis
MDKRKIIVGINTSFSRKPHTGIGQVTLNFLQKLNGLKSDKIDFVLYLEEDLPKEIKLSDGFTKKIFLPIYRRDDLIRKIWWEKFSLPRQIKKDKCDIFLSLYQCPTVLNKKIKHIMLVHDIVPKLFPEYLNNFRKKIYWNLTEKGIKNANKILTVSKRTEKDLIRHLNVDADKISVNYIDADEVYKKTVSDDAKNKILKKYKLNPGYILAGGGYEIRKNVENVIRAYKFLEDKFKGEWELPPLTIYGKILPKNNKLALNAEKLIKELNLTKKIKLLGEVSQKDMPAVFANASLFVYPSYYEGFGLPVLEAMNVGTPVITSKNSSLPEVGNDAVLYCEADNIHDIAMVMRNVLLNEDLRETLHRRGMDRAQNFSWQKFTEKVWNIMN